MDLFELFEAVISEACEPGEGVLTAEANITLRHVMFTHPYSHSHFEAHLSEWHCAGDLITVWSWDSFSSHDHCDSIILSTGTPDRNPLSCYRDSRQTA